MPLFRYAPLRKRVHGARARASCGDALELTRGCAPATALQLYSPLRTCRTQCRVIAGRQLLACPLLNRGRVSKPERAIWQQWDPREMMPMP